MNSRSRFKYTFGRLARIHLIFVVLTTLFFTLAAGFLQIYIDYQKKLERVEEIIIMIEKSYKAPISSSLFNFNTPQLKLLVEGISILPYIAGVKVLEETGTETHTVQSVGKISGEDLRIRSYPLKYTYQGDERLLGTLLVSIDTEKIYSQVKNEIFIILGTTALQTFVLALLILYLVQLLTVKPLKKIAIHVRRMELKDSAKTQPIEIGKLSRVHRGDEIDEIIKSINTMFDRLKNSYISLIDTKEELKNSLEDKKALLRELYHRTKNNMQVIRSILALKSEYASQDSAFHDLVKDVDARIFAMSLVHQKLYQSENLSRINMREYIEELVPHVIETYKIEPRHISIDIKAEDVELLIDTAIPCGQILSELICNSMKHAFSDNVKYKIYIALWIEESNQIFLRYSDNGKGVSQGFRLEDQQSLGVQTILQLAERQMLGHIDVFKRDKGLGIEIQFPAQLYRERV